MTNWLARAKAEISKSPECLTANSDERTLTAVMAVPNLGKSEISQLSIGSNGSTQVANLRKYVAANEAIPGMTPGEEKAIRFWLAHIEETDPATIADVLGKCRADANQKNILLEWAEAIPRPIVFDDDRRRCDQCANLTERGLCLAARRGEIVASRNFEPVRDLLQRCIGYKPKATESDQRTGRERWPGLIPKKGSQYANN